jgi:hypothetical protein
VEVFFREAGVALEETDFVELCPIGMVAREVASTSATLRVTADEVLRSWLSALADGLAADGLGPDAAASLAATVVAAIEGGFLLARVARRVDVLADSGRHLAALIRSEVSGLTA